MKFGRIINMKVLLKLVMINGKVKRYKTGTSKRFLKKLNTLDWKKCYIKVVYGKDLDVFGKKTLFYNAGEYTDKAEAVKAFIAFVEV